VFAGGWTLDAVEEVCNARDELGIDTLDGLSSLADKSLVRAMAIDVEGLGETRFGMLQVIREFAAEKLDTEPDAETIRRRHAEWVLTLAEKAQPELRRTDLRRWQHRLRREEENLRTALRWALDRGEAEIGLRTAAAVWDFWHYWAEIREGITWLESLLELPAAAGPTDARARGLDALGGLVYWQAKADEAWDLYEAAVAIRRELGNDHDVANALVQSAWAAAARYDIETGNDRAREARDLFEESGDATNAQFVSEWMVVESVILGAGGDAEAAVVAERSTHETAKALGRAHDAADTLGGVALLHRIIGDPARGIPVAQASLTAWHELGNLGRLPFALKVLAALELQAGNPRRAVRLEAAAQKLSEDIGGDLFQVFGQLGNAVEEARPLLDPEEHARAVEEGRTLGLDEHVRFALETRDTGLAPQLE
jgi:hypothetical protein